MHPIPIELYLKIYDVLNASTCNQLNHNPQSIKQMPAKLFRTVNERGASVVQQHLMLYDTPHITRKQ